MINIVKAALQSTVQDMGRIGFRHLGVGKAGAMDSLSLAVGNYLVGNTQGAAGLELIMPPARIHFDQACVIALTGAECSAQLEGKAVVLGRAVQADSGQTLVLGAPRNGICAYLSISGGIDVPRVLGSCSTDLQGGIGGLEGRLLRDGDSLKLHASDLPHPARTAVLLPHLEGAIRVIPGPEFDSFGPESRAAFLEKPWRIGGASNRMAYRLEGPTLIRRDSQELRSHAVFPGVIQVPPGGAPLVLMAEAQATGGYPKIATVIEADLPKLAQTRPGTVVHFELETRARARLAWQRQQIYLQRLQRSLNEN